MSYENKCPDCGANLDPGEKCDCRLKEESKDIIVIKQLPIIAQKLQSIKTEIENRVELALSLECNEDTVKEVKDTRAKINRELKAFEDKRKEVKKAIMAPYEEFEGIYRDCITDAYRRADGELKCKIDSVETELKGKKKAEVREYFDEYMQSKGIDFVTYENANINVTLSSSMKSLKEQAKAFIDRICGDLSLISTQEHKDEILYEYKQTLNVSQAVTAVVNRYNAIGEAKAAEEEHKAEKEAEAKYINDVEVLAPPVAEEAVLTLKFTVRATRTRLRVLKEFLEKEGFDYE